MRSKAVIGLVVMLMACGSSSIIAPKTNQKSSCDSEGCPIPGMSNDGGSESEAQPPSVLLLNPANEVAVESKVDNRCPEGMVHISGDYCPQVQETCLYFVDIHGNHIPENTHTSNRCGEFKKPTKCLSKKLVHKDFCIDTWEYPNVKGKIPQSWMSWYDVKKACEGQGKRLCTKSEWTFSCEGRDIQPYSYGDGYHRDTTACNFDRVLGQKEAAAIEQCKHFPISPDKPCRKYLDSLLVPSGSMETCQSPFHVFDQLGNLDEFVVNETGHPYKSSLVSGHVFGVRNACRPETSAHNEFFKWWETSGRCCND